MDFEVQLRRAAKGNRSAMQRIEEDSRGIAWLFCRLLTENEEQAAEACKQAYTLLWETLKAEKKPEKNTPGRWAAICAARVCQRLALAKNPDAFRETREHRVAEASGTVEEAARRLTLRRRFIWLLAASQQLEPRQIAAVLKLREEKVAASLQQAREELAVWVGENGTPADCLSKAAEAPLPAALEEALQAEIRRQSPPIWQKNPSAFWTGIGIAVILAAVLPLLVVSLRNRPAAAEAFDHAAYLEDNGFYKDITAKDYVTLCSYEGIPVDAQVQQVSREALQEELDSRIAVYAETLEVTDRPVEDGDTLHIDYDGTIDGVAFAGGSTNGAGSVVTIGVTNFIDGFLEQLIGHMPGEAFTIDVTFPENYHDPELSGKDAQFAITIHSISETKNPDLTDAFVAESFVEEGWSTVEELKAGLTEEIRGLQISRYLKEYVMENSTVSQVPELLVKYQQESLRDYYRQTAAMYSTDVNTFVSMYLGYDSMDALLASYRDSHEQAARESLVVQAIAEDAGLEVTQQALKDYFTENFGTEEYADYEEAYGIGYLKLNVLPGLVDDYLYRQAEIAG